MSCLHLYSGYNKYLEQLSSACSSRGSHKTQAAGIMDCPRVINESYKLWLGLFICFGIGISYYPQISSISRSRSSRGISLVFLVLGFIGTTSTVVNVSMLQRQALRCCITSWPFGQCIQSLIGLTQVVLQCTFFTIFLVSVYIYLPSDHRVEAQVCGYILATWIALLSLGTIFVIYSNELIESWAGVLGVLALLTGMVQYVPQIVYTFAVRSFGALSPHTLLMQCPGSFLFALSLAMSPGTNWTSWISFVVCGALQGMLLIMYAVFRIYPGTPAASDLFPDENLEDQPLLAEVVDDFLGISHQNSHSATAALSDEPS